MSAPHSDVARQVGVVALLTVYVILLLGIPTRLVFAPLGSAGAPSLVFGLFCAFAWFLAQLWRTTNEPGARRPIRFALACFLVCVGISFTLAMTRPIEPDEISQADVALITCLSMAGVLLVAHDGLVHLRDIDTILRRFSMAGGLMATLGLAQYVTKQLIVDRLSIPGLRANGVADVAFRNGLVRISGTATSPIELGALLTMLFPIALHCALHQRDIGRFRRWFPVLTVFAALALSGSRSAYVAIAIVFVVLMIGWPNRLRWTAGPLAIVGAILMGLLLPPLYRSVRSMFVTAQDDPSIASRTDSYALASQFFARWPVFGRGLGTFLPKYRIFDNEYLGLLVSVGIVGTAAFAGILVTAIVLLFRRRRFWADERSRDRALALAASIAAGSASIAFFDGFGFPMTMGTLFLLLGIAGAYVNQRGRSPVPEESWGRVAAALPARTVETSVGPTVPAQRSPSLANDTLSPGAPAT
ncbi:O-antigen ligase family protein [Cellulomonas sp. 73-92]|uniref:O-antigen ligase family protein n=1 Tax=Cellulomonas sp. 73-92 TaxID=1895740 RepID=UPI000A698A20|nr:O-antigen ligase family protein [Cellulomonas sp. 73-92]